MRDADQKRAGRARALRRAATPTERLLWGMLRDRRLGGHKFVRQCPIGHYFADFACREAMLVVELDGSQHIENPHDARRDAFMLARGYSVLRFWNDAARIDAESIRETILATLKGDGVTFVGPDDGEMACGEYGPGRMAEPLAIVAAIERLLASPTAIPLPPGVGERPATGPLAGKRVVITSGPTHEPIDPVRYIANRSSGKQGHAIARAAADAGAEVVLISGPVAIPDPDGVTTRHVESARDMLAAVEAALPADIFIATAAVADWRVEEPGAGKMKKGADGPPALRLVENPDILATVAGRAAARPQLGVGFAAETDRVIEYAKGKLAKKRCDLVVANDVSPAGGVMGGDENTVHLVDANGVVSWPQLRKDEVARRLVIALGERLGGTGG